MKLRHSGISILLAAAFSLSLFIPVKGYASQLYTTDGINVRKKPDGSSKIKTTLPAGTPVTKTGQDGNWIAINAEGIRGYIYKDYLSSNPDAVSSGSPASSYESFVNSDDVNLRKKASDSCKVKEVLNTGASVTVYSKKGNWTRIKTASGKTGYIFSIYIGKKSNSVQTKSVPSKSDVISGYRSRAISYARGRLGDTYSQSNRDMAGYADCSSLVRDAYNNASGKFIGDTTVTQVETMSSYLYAISSIYDVTPGDLVYHTSNDNHAGIYLGNGKVLHASQTAGTVKISTFAEESTYWEYGCNAASYCFSH
ncbi:MAG: SH3 domain-containing protein [Anaerobutyricum sp.]|nr:SH3 domain-containing protein [Anaerobutyricum sp.]